MSSVLSIPEWNPEEIKFGLPKVNKLGGKSINVYSKQTNKFLEISTPRMMTWGISDFYDKEKDTHDGKFSLTLNFPNADFETPQTTAFLEKLKKFNEVILDHAFENRDKWFGGQDIPNRSVLQFTMYPILKYPKLIGENNIKRIDYTRAPSITAKVEQYEGRWKPRIFNTNKELIFPSANPEHSELTPADFVPKFSNVSCTIECVGIWIGGKGWGVSWRLKQCVVKPPDEISSDVCQVKVLPEDLDIISKQTVNGTSDAEIDSETATVYKAGKQTVQPVENYLDDSEDEPETSKPEPKPEPEPEPEQVVEQQPVVTKKVMKRVTKK